MPMGLGLRGTEANDEDDEDMALYDRLRGFLGCFPLLEPSLL